MVSASVTTNDLVETVDVVRPGHSQLSAAGVARGEQEIAALRKAVAVISGASVVADNPFPGGDGRSLANATIVFPTANFGVLVKALHAVGWSVQDGVPGLRPRDADALRNQAFVKAEQIAKVRAEEIASAAGEHAGALIDVTPTALDLLQGMPTGAAFFAQPSSDEIKVTAIFTFAITP